MGATNPQRRFPYLIPGILTACICLAAQAGAGLGGRAGSGAGGLRGRIAGILGREPAREADWGILVEEEATGAVLYELHPNRYYLPASNAKLFTAALALAELGPSYRWRTTLETSGTIGTGGTLAGDLVLVGRGDPNLSNRVFPFLEKVAVDGPPGDVIARLADRIAGLGVKRITGDVVADDSYFVYGPYPPGWNVDDVTADYGAPVSALSIDDNALEVDVTPGARAGEAARLDVLPWAAYYHFTNRVTTARRGADAQLRLSRQPDSTEIAVIGRVAAGGATEQIYPVVEQPARYAAALLRHMLEERGIEVDGGTRTVHLLEGEDAPTERARRVLAEHVSPTLGEEVRYLLKVSQNLHAECLLRTVAHVRSGVGSLENGLAIERQFLTRLGIGDEASLADGSGLSRYDLVTPESVVKLLRESARQPWSQVFTDALPVAGRDGTLEKRMSGTPAAGRIFAKTGTLDHDDSLSGYATTLGGRRLVFSILVNNTPPNSKFDPYVDEIAEAIVEEGGGVAGRARGK